MHEIQKQKLEQNQNLISEYFEIASAIQRFRCEVRVIPMELLTNPPLKMNWFNTNNEK